jgi:enoyl-CoA hydratase
MSATGPAIGSSVSYRAEGAVALITLDDGKANALGFEALDGLTAALDRAESEASAVAVVGRPGRFSAGFDLSVMTGSLEGARELLGRGAEFGLRCAESPLPVVLGVTGHALAMGGILLSCADVRIGAEGPFKLGLNEVAIGMPVPAFAVELCRDRLSPRAFNRAVQLAHVHTPGEALEAGFLDELVAADEVPARAVEVAAELAARLHAGPFRQTRRTVRGALVDRLRAAIEADLAAFDVATPGS